MNTLRFDRRPLVVVALALLWTASAGAQPLALDVVMERAGKYVATFAEQFSSVVAEERSDQSSSGGFNDFVTTRRLVADILVVRVPGTTQWMSFRDVFEVNGAKVRDREDRLLKLFVESPTTAVSQARRLADESARFNVGDLRRNFNLPTTGLFILHPSTQGRFTFKHAGDKNLDGIRYWVVRGTEWQRPTMVQTTMGRDTELVTEHLIDPETGRVARSTLHLKYPAQTEITVEYRPDEKLGIWVPSRMEESYDQGRMKIQATATYSNFRRFQVNTDTSFRDER